MDGDEVSACAAVLEVHADDMARTAQQVAAAAAGMEWESRAADAARGQVDRVTRLLVTGATQVREAADALRAHAVAVDTALGGVRRALTAALPGGDRP